jgi:hypothetical protein
MKQLSSLLVLLVLLSGSLFSDPKWYGESKRSPVSLKKNLIGYGRALTYEDAVRNAQSDVASQLSVTVHTEITMVDNERFSSRFQNREKFSKSTIKTHVSQNLYGFEALKRETEGDYYFVLGVLNKKRYIKALRTSLKDQEKEIRTSIKRARKLLETNNFFDALGNFQEALVNTEMFYEKKAILDALSNKPYKLKDFHSVLYLQNKITTMIAAVNVVVVKGDMQSIGMGKRLPKPIRFKVSFNDNQYSFPISGAVINLSYASGKLIDTQHTNINGEVGFKPLAIPQNNKRFQLVADLILEDHFDEAPSYKTDYKARGKYRIIDKETPIFYSLEVIAKNMQFMDNLEDSLNGQLKSYGLIPSKRPQQLHIKVYYAVLDKQEIKGPFKIDYLVKGKLIVEMYQTDSYLGQIHMTESGISHIGAIAQEKLISKFSIDAERFFELLNRKDKIKKKEFYIDKKRF